ncbi:polyprenyl synthetase family protein [Nevskia sp.]|uniref:polyprenyl synthetase family protein n=1 Tax=Nevskia sp. TaxID=1929292 RepID=UPI0025FD3378|nr:farnesyl diphosphate synthase [Nevskia sp.]
MTSAASFQTRVSEYRSRFDRVLDSTLPPASTDPVLLHEAMRYACNGGKRLRALLVYAAGEALGLQPGDLDAPAVAVELIHAYSLVHDDLPAMDDDDLRRGQPTVHKVYDEAMGILVGDALQTLAFEALTRRIPTDGIGAQRLLQVVAALGFASGSLGMVGGQAVDIESEGKKIPLERLQSLHARKTGALILCCLRMPTALAAPDAVVVKALEDYGRLLGLAYQIQDDVLDITQSTEQLGKTAGKDVVQEKSTYPALLGFDAAKALAAKTFDDARNALAPLGDSAEGLRWLALEIEGRNH